MVGKEREVASRCGGSGSAWNAGISGLRVPNRPFPNAKFHGCNGVPPLVWRVSFHSTEEVGTHAPAGTVSVGLNHFGHGAGLGRGIEGREATWRREGNNGRANQATMLCARAL